MPGPFTLLGALVGPFVGLLLWAALKFIVRRELSLLARIPCPSCGAAFGMAAAKSAKRRYSEQCQAERNRLNAERGEILRIHFDDKWPVKCERCGYDVKYDLTAKSLVTTP